MSPDLAAIYQDTLHAQVALIRLSDRAATTTDTLEDWNAAEDELLSAYDRFLTHRHHHGPMNGPKHASPGLAGGLHGALAAGGSIDTPPPISHAVAPIS